MMTAAHKTLRNGLQLLFFAILTSIGPVFGEPLNWSLLPQNWNWCAHLDVANLKKSPLALEWIDQIVEQSEDLRKLREIPLIGLDPGEDIQSVTILGSGFDPQKGIVLLHGQFDRKRLVALVSMSPRYETEEFQGKVLHRWWDSDQNAQMIGTFLSDNCLAFGRDDATLRGMIAASDAKAAPTDPFFLSDPDAFFVFHARGLDHLPVPFASPIVNRSRRLSLVIGQRADRVFGEVVAEFQSADTANDVRDVLAGLTAFGRLQNADRPGIYELLQTTTFSATSNVAHGKWEGTASLFREAWDRYVAPEIR